MATRPIIYEMSILFFIETTFMIEFIFGIDFPYMTLENFVVFSVNRKSNE
jgi:hypothetical protein